MGLAVGQIIDNRYRIEQFIGSGGMADVYLAVDTRDNYPYAIKLLRESLLEDADLIARFQSEAEKLSKLQHPNIVRFYNFIASGEYAYIVMDYIPGYPLSRLLRLRRDRQEGPLPLEATLGILLQSSWALARIHDEGLVHRDIKTSNILIREEDGRVFLTDLGIAKELESVDVTRGMIGTRAYMAPEQYLARSISSATDTYAFGIVAFELLTGDRPFRGTTQTSRERGTSPSDSFLSETRDQRLQEEHLYQEPPLVSALVPGMPPAVDQVMSRAMAKTPANRYQRAEEFVQSLHQALLPILPQELHDLSAIGPTRDHLRTGGQVLSSTHILPTLISSPSISPGSRHQNKILAGLLVAGILVALGIGLLILGSLPSDGSTVSNETATAQMIAQSARTPIPPTEAIPTEIPIPSIEMSLTQISVSSTGVSALPGHNPEERTDESITPPGIVLIITASPLPTETLTNTPSPTNTASPPTSARRPSNTPMLSHAAATTPSRTPTRIDTPLSPTSTRRPSNTPRPSRTPTATPSHTPTLTDTPVTPTSTRRPSNTPRPSRTPTATNTSTPAAVVMNTILPVYVLYEDDFTAPETDYWIPADVASRQWLSDRDALRIVPGAQNFPAEFLTVFEPIQDTRFTVNLRLESENVRDPADSIAGVVLRFQQNGGVSEYYVFGVEFQASEWVFAYYTEAGANKTREFISRGPLPEEVSNPRTAEIELAVLAQSTEYALAINGADVGEVRDSRLTPEGNFGVINDNRNTARVAYLFESILLEIVGPQALAFSARTPTPPASFESGPEVGTTSATVALGSVRALHNALAANQNSINCNSYLSAFNGLLAMHPNASGNVRFQIERALQAGDNIKNVCYERGSPSNMTIDDRIRQSLYILQGVLPEVITALGG